MTPQLKLAIYHAILFVRGSGPYRTGSLGPHESLLIRAHNKLVNRLATVNEPLDEPTLEGKP